VHAKGLVIPDEAGNDAVGGAYAWVCVLAPDSASAIASAIAALGADPAFLNEIRNPDDALSNAAAEKVVPLSHDAAQPAAGIVFYVDPDEIN
jgi:hypothetical protein